MRNPIVDNCAQLGYNSNGGQGKIMRMNALRAQLGSRKPAIGTMIEEISSPFIVHILANAGYDFLFVDMEHGRFDQEVKDIRSKLEH